uniref:Histone deacetylase HOS3 n=1 Tax=Kwoniella bestiolae CBS 10118 TaxID=1296100 RepID=A0A1B9GG69_9TREE|nr:histone deacetylase HOS3 [Kwoniella bestiolae CBS 10118]OCF30053.1 histone deacetylase HOS3 [Kwoniella bestiolae CBS 10118]
MTTSSPIGLFIQPACLQHKYIRHPNSSHIFERPERLRAVLLGVAAAIARLESVDQPSSSTATSQADDLSGLLSSLSIESSSSSSITSHLHIIPPPPQSSIPGTILQHHPAVQLAHSPVPESPFPYLGQGSSSSASGSIPSSPYLKDLVKWASEAIDKIKETGCEIPPDLGLNAGDLYLGPGSIVAIEGAIQTVCQAVDHVVSSRTPPSTPASASTTADVQFNKAFCAIRPPGHHCGEDLPSGFCYVNNVVIGAMHAYLQHDIDRAIIIDFDLHHGNGTQALVMPLNAAAHAEDLQVKAGKPQTMLGRDGRKRRGWKGFYGSVHDIYSYPCEDGDVDLIKDASISLAAHGQYIENIHLQPYENEADFYARIYPLYLALLKKAKVYMDETGAEPSRTIVFISAGFDACEHEHQGMQRHDRRVPTSFYSRYTKDIAAFADKYTEGKIVSVLEGGYSDRALTSAAMGHIVGMKGAIPERCDEWWTEQELVNFEKATKKRRTGKLAPFPSELSSQPHLQRTHILLGHFECVGTASESVPPSVNNTPLPPAVRMTLRDRKRPEDIALPQSTDITPPARRAIRGRGGGWTGSTAATPTRSRVKNDITTTPTHSSRLATKSTATTPNAKANRGLRVEDVPLPNSVSEGALDRIVKSEMGVEEALKALESVKIEDTPMPTPTQTQLQPSSSTVRDQSIPKVKATSSESQANIHPISQNGASRPSLPTQNSIPKIILRIPRPVVPEQRRPDQPPPPSVNETPYYPLSATTGSIYPTLPPQNPRFQAKDEDRLAYREGSTSASEGGTEGDYTTAPSGGESPLPNYQNSLV